MKINHICAILLCLAATACGGGSTANKASSNSNKISFGLYDISSSGPFSGITTQPSAANAVNASRARLEAQNVPVATEQEPRVINIDRKVIRNAELSLETKSPEKSQQTITAIAESKGGFVVESQQSSSDVRVNVRDVVTMTVRVPAEKFAEAVDEIRKTASRVVVESVRGQDVTEEFIDIEAHLKAKKALEQQFMEIMKRANSVEEALSVQSQLAEVRGEIEKIEGRKRFLENQTSLSTIKIQLQTPAAFSANSAGITYRLTQSFSTGLDIALNFILGLVTFVVGVIPFALFIGLPAYLIIRYFLRRQSRPRTVTQIAEEELARE